MSQCSEIVKFVAQLWDKQWFYWNYCHSLLLGYNNVSSQECDMKDSVKSGRRVRYEAVCFAGFADVSIFIFGLEVWDYIVCNDIEGMHPTWCWRCWCFAWSNRCFYQQIEGQRQYGWWRRREWQWWQRRCHSWHELDTVCISHLV